VQQHLGRQVGVGKVDVSLVDGKVVIYPKEDSHFDPVAIFKAVYDSGVSVTEMTITANGELLDDPAKGTVFRIASNEVFEVKPNVISEQWMRQAGSGKNIKLRGLLYKKPSGRVKRKAPETFPLEILEVLN
jgi:hypothetical protein